MYYCVRCGKCPYTSGLNVKGLCKACQQDKSINKVNPLLQVKTADITKLCK